MAFFERVKLLFRGGASGPGTVDGRSDGDANHPEDSRAPGEGGRHLYDVALGDIRWVSVNEALNHARSGIDPTLFQDNLMALPIESATLHEHEHLRDNLANLVGAEVREISKDLWAIASRIASVRTELKRSEHSLIESTRDLRRIEREISLSLDEADRAEAIRHSESDDRLLTKARAKVLVGSLLVAAEALLTFFIFDTAFENHLPFPFLQPALLSMGVILLFVVVPHFAAIGVKKGVIRRTYHQMLAAKEINDRPQPDNPAADQGASTFHRGDGSPASAEDGPDRRSAFTLYEIEASHDAEVNDDRGFRVVASLISAALVLLMIPLSIIRAHHVIETYEYGGMLLWFSFFFLLQFGISAYFFFREWNDFGQPSHYIAMLRKRHESLKDQHHEVTQDHCGLMAQFGGVVQHLIFTVQQAIRWDSGIVQWYLGTIYQMRQAMLVERPDLHPFIYGIQLPLPAGFDAGDITAGHIVGLENPLDVTYRHPQLAQATPFGRKFLYQVYNVGLVEPSGASVSVVDGAGEDLSESPGQAIAPRSQGGSGALDMATLAKELLDSILRQLWDMEAQYKTSEFLDAQVPERWDGSDTILAAGLSSVGSNGHAAHPATTPVPDQSEG